MARNCAGIVPVVRNGAPSSRFSASKENDPQVIQRRSPLSSRGEAVGSEKPRLTSKILHCVPEGPPTVLRRSLRSSDREPGARSHAALWTMELRSR
jgi:hypothetical protein